MPVGAINKLIRYIYIYKYTYILFINYFKKYNKTQQFGLMFPKFPTIREKTNEKKKETLET